MGAGGSRCGSYRIGVPERLRCYGKPQRAGSAALAGVNASTPETMELGATMGPMPLADKARYGFWLRYFESSEGARAPVF